jgi:hypothetical protein
MRLWILVFLIILPTAVSAARDCDQSIIQGDSVPRHGCGGDPWSLRPDSPFSDELQNQFKKGFEAPAEGGVTKSRPIPTPPSFPKLKVPSP